MTKAKNFNPSRVISVIKSNSRKRIDEEDKHADRRGSSSLGRRIHSKSSSQASKSSRSGKFCLPALPFKSSSKATREHKGRQEEENLKDENLTQNVQGRVQKFMLKVIIIININFLFLQGCMFLVILKRVLL